MEVSAFCTATWQITPSAMASKLWYQIPDTRVTWYLMPDTGLSQIQESRDAWCQIPDSVLISHAFKPQPQLSLNFLPFAFIHSLSLIPRHSFLVACSLSLIFYSIVLGPFRPPAVCIQLVSRRDRFLPFAFTHFSLLTFDLIVLGPFWPPTIRIQLVSHCAHFDQGSFWSFVVVSCSRVGWIRAKCLG